MGIFVVRRKFIMLQVIALLLYLCAMSLFNLDESFTGLFILSSWFFLSYTYLFYVEIKKASDFNPFIILILASIIFVGIDGVNLYLKVVSGEAMKFGSYPINDILAKGVFYLSLEHLLMLIGFYAVESYYRKDHDYNIPIYNKIKKSYSQYFKWAICIYIIVWILRGINNIYPLASLGSIFSNIAAMGHLVALLLLLFAKIQKPKDKRCMQLHWVIVAIEIFLVLDMGMKELIIRNLVPYAIYLLLQYKARRMRLDISMVMKLGLLFVFVLNAFIYISVFRDISIRRNTEWSNITIKETLSEYGDYIFREGRYEKTQKKRNKGLDNLMSRAGAIGCNAWSINYAQTKGTKPEYLYFCSVGLIPRFLWPGKPDLQIGGMMYKLATDDESSWTRKMEGNIASVSIGFIGSCYFSLGFWGALLIPLFMGVFCSFFWVFIKRYLYYNVLAIWAFFSILFIYLKDCEGFQDCGMIFFGWSCIYILLIKYVFSGRRPRTREITPKTLN